MFAPKAVIKLSHNLNAALTAKIF